MVRGVLVAPPIGHHPAGAIFEDRAAAGRRLADALLAHAGSGALVLAIPRGGVPVAAVVAARLDAVLDVLVVRKIGAPHQSELAIGAVTSTGVTVLNDDLIRQIDVPAAYVRSETDRQRQEADVRETRLREGRSPLDCRDRLVILVDDGLATGATMRAAVRAVRLAHARSVIAAVPVGSAEACADIAAEGAEVVCLQTPEPFFSVGGYYERFDQVSDEEAARLLRGTQRALPVALTSRS